MLLKPLLSEFSTRSCSFFDPCSYFSSVNSWNKCGNAERVFCLFYSHVVEIDIFNYFSFENCFFLILDVK